MTAAGTAWWPRWRACRNSPSSSARTRRRPSRTAASTPRRSTATTRRSAPVLEAFLRGRTGDVLEIGSGTGQHAVAFAQQIAGRSPGGRPTSTTITCAASRPGARTRSSTTCRRRCASTPARRTGGCRRSACRRNSSRCSAPTSSTSRRGRWREGLFAGAGRHLRAGGRLFLYGPFRRDGVHNAPSNAAFDASLRRAESGMGRARHRRPEKTRRDEWASLRRACRNAVEQRDPGVRTDHSGLKFIATPLMQ